MGQQGHVGAHDGAVAHVSNFAAVDIGQQADGHGLFDIEILAEPTGDDHAVHHGKIHARVSQKGGEAGIDGAFAVNQVFSGLIR